METEIYTYAQLKELFFNSGKDEVIFKHPINWCGNMITGIRKNHKMISSIEEDGSSTYNLSRCEESSSSYYKLFIDALMESI